LRRCHFIKFVAAAAHRYARGETLFAAMLAKRGHQVTQVMALFYIGPGVYTIFTRASVIFTALLALAFFPEERVVIRQWQFQIGTLLGLIGAFGVIWFQANANSHDQHIALPGLFIAFTATFCWALYGVLIKRPSAELGSIRSFGVVSFITSALLLPLTLAFGKIETPFQAGLQANLVLIVSAVTCITLAHVLYYVAIREIGVALSQSLQLLCPALRWRCQPGSLANDSRTPSFGAPAFCLSGPSLQCAPSLSPRRKRPENI
jgi:drug/metabolite transporter (DMT)-like permease